MFDGFENITFECTKGFKLLLCPVDGQSLTRGQGRVALLLSTRRRRGPMEQPVDSRGLCHREGWMEGRWGCRWSVAQDHQISSFEVAGRVGSTSPGIA